MSKRNQEMTRLGIVGFLGICLILAISMVALIAGMRLQMDRVLEVCDQGGKFYKLDADGDVPYRCTRVIDYPPTTEGSTNVTPETD